MCLATSCAHRLAQYRMVRGPEQVSTNQKTNYTKNHRHRRRIISSWSLALTIRYPDPHAVCQVSWFTWSGSGPGVSEQCEQACRVHIGFVHGVRAGKLERSVELPPTHQRLEPVTRNGLLAKVEAELPRNGVAVILYVVHMRQSPRCE